MFILSSFLCYHLFSGTEYDSVFSESDRLQLLCTKKQSTYSFIHCRCLTSPLKMHFTWNTPPGPYRGMTCRERELTLDYAHTFLTTLGHRGPPRISDQLNAGATSETRQTWKTIHNIHASFHSNKANMKGWFWRPNDIRGPCEPKDSWHLSYKWGKTPKKTSPRRLFPTGDRIRTRCTTSVHATAYYCLLPPAWQRWTK